MAPNPNPKSNFMARECTWILGVHLNHSGALGIMRVHSVIHLSALILQSNN